jgi:hypothetical protein
MRNRIVSALLFYSLAFNSIAIVSLAFVHLLSRTRIQSVAIVSGLSSADCAHSIVTSFTLSS